MGIIAVEDSPSEKKMEGKSHTLMYRVIYDGLKESSIC